MRLRGFVSDPCPVSGDRCLVYHNTLFRGEESKESSCQSAVGLNHHMLSYFTTGTLCVQCSTVVQHLSLQFSHHLPAGHGDTEHCLRTWTRKTGGNERKLKVNYIFLIMDKMSLHNMCTFVTGQIRKMKFAERNIHLIENKFLHYR